MKRVYFVRHGESEVNAHTLKVRIDDRDAKLTIKGQEQSRFIADRIKNIPIDVVISSPYVRTRDTARFISEVTGHPVEFSELITERRDPSSLTGMEYDDPKAQEIFRSWIETFYVSGKRVEDGENYDDIVSRVRKALEYIDSRSEEHILVVTHGYFLRTLLAYVIFGDDLSPDLLRSFIGATKTDNTGITLLTDQAMPYDDIDPSLSRWRIRVFNDHAHLG